MRKALIQFVVAIVISGTVGFIVVSKVKPMYEDLAYQLEMMTK
jgi:hypothetical protein